MKLLFVCSRNRWRSPTAEEVFRRKGWQTRSVGTSPHARRRVRADDLRWADVVFAMEARHRQRLRARFGRLLDHKELYVLRIRDLYRPMDPELVSLLRSRVQPILTRLSAAAHESGSA
ncbi:MAG: phosphotyrosine protein phosphatase [Deltaproteobacteria bacterium]|nr:phosphotyrosine protein phosphatase [Deltaproteobacteria bacterium]